MLRDEDARVQTRWIVGLALMVAFVGILNAMLLSVTERIAEIGTMKCLGALDSLIVELFLMESAMQGFVGTALGVAIGLLLTFAEGASRYGMPMWGLIPVGTTARLALICLAAGTGLTIVGALYPAWQAARMQPVDAMRSEI
jgi:ABC-type lipoprotein release transport system permease subunit